MIFTKILRVPPIFYLSLHDISVSCEGKGDTGGPSALDSIVNFLNLTLNINHKL